MKRAAPEEKDYLNTKEAIDYYALSQRKFNRLLADKDPYFVARYRGRKLIVKAEFEKYLEQHPEIRRREGYGKKGNI